MKRSASQELQGDCSYKFGKVQIFKNQELGHGSYGAVYKAKCDALPCAAKLIYPVLFGSNTLPQATPPAQGSHKEHRQPMRRFEMECRFLSQINHPNVIQYLGMHRDPETNAPVLLMELMDECLTHFLETAQNPVLFHIQVNILHDVVLALEFLHTNGITHRDLSSNNVLLIAGSRAKVTDFGMSTLSDAAGPHLASMTHCPGTPVYMPPEALDEPPVYSEKLDCFSFGVLAIQVITREFPKPADRFQAKELLDPAQPARKIHARVLVPELERRQFHISLIPTAHPLRPIALDCLKDRDADRPTAQQLCESMEQLKTIPLYASSIRQITDKDLLIQTQRESIQNKEKQLQDQRKTIQDQRKTIQDQQQTIQKLQSVEQDKQRLTEVTQQQTQQLRQVQKEVQQLRQQVQSSEELVAHFQEGMTDKDRQIEQLHIQLQKVEVIAKSDQQQQQPEVKEKTLPTAAGSKDFKLSWKRSVKAPTGMTRGSSTIIGNTIYINPYNSRDIYAFQYNNSTRVQWSTLPQCPYNHSALAAISSKLATVGGQDTNGMPTDKVIIYDKEKWTETDTYPSMPTKRFWVAVLSTTTHVVAIGGRSSDSESLKTVEILNVSTKQWSTADPLPYGIIKASITLCGETIYMMGGRTFTFKDKSVLSCQLRDLLKQKEPFSSTNGHSAIWLNVPDLNARYSTCVATHGHVLAIGGEDKNYKNSSVVYRYDQKRNEWIAVNNNMTTAKYYCLATALPDDNILVVGGKVDRLNETDETEISTIS